MSRLTGQNIKFNIGGKSPVPRFVQTGICYVLATIMVMSLGCDDPETAMLQGAGGVASVETLKIVPMSGADSTVIEEVETTEAESDGDAVLQEQEGEPDPSESAGVLEKANDLFGKAAASGGAAKDWVQDQLGEAAGAGGQAASDTINWANETYKSLKEQGLTTASNTGEWLSEDWKNSRSWEYKIVNLDSENDEMTAELNKLGKAGWECFHTEGSRFYLKKPHESYLRELPFKDFIKLVPLLHRATQ